MKKVSAALFFVILLLASLTACIFNTRGTPITSSSPSAASSPTAVISPVPTPSAEPEAAASQNEEQLPLTLGTPVNIGGFYEITLKDVYFTATLAPSNPAGAFYTYKPFIGDMWLVGILSARNLSERGRRRGF